jgi:hypothetical protein
MDGRSLTTGKLLAAMGAHGDFFKIAVVIGYHDFPWIEF